MAIIPLRSEVQVKLEVVLKGIQELDTPDLEEFVQQVNLILERRKAKADTALENQLIADIHQAFPQDQLVRLEKLQTLPMGERTKEETEELTVLLDQVEVAESQRLENLLSLAALWQVSLEEIRERLGIKAFIPHG